MWLLRRRIDWGLRDYGITGQLGLEPTPDCLGWATGAPCGVCFVCHMVSVYREVWRVLRDDGTVFLNLGDCYASSTNGTSAARTKAIGKDDRTFRDKPFSTVTGGLKPKDLVGMPWRVALALQADGWYLRSDIIWSKPNPMPESVTDRPTKAHEYLFLLAKAQRYYYDAEAVKEEANAEYAGRYKYPLNTGAKEQNGAGRPDGASNTAGMKEYTGYRNRRTVWEIPAAPYAGAHFATYPAALVEPCILAGTSSHGCCAECGAPWERVVEVEEKAAAWKSGNPGLMTVGKAYHKDHGEGARDKWTTGWRPTCGHADAPTVPAIVLDPFAGSGTTGQVAKLHGRRFVGMDLSREYLTTLALPRAEGKQTADSLATLPLFGGMLK